MTALLQVNDLRTRFHTSQGTVHAVNGISFEVRTGETVAIVGESGSGKSVSMLSILRLLPEPPARIESGEVLFKGRDLLKLNRRNMRAINGAEIGMVFQDPMSSLNPVLTVGFQIAEAAKVHGDVGEADARARALELLRLVGIPDAERRLKDYPHQFSGGMRQRVMIAMALACRPDLLIADEPTTALDVTVQAQILRLVRKIKQQLGMSVIWITHDLGVVAHLAERVIVMYAGTIVEDAPVRTLFARPRHPYTIGLLASLPRLDGDASTKLRTIGGQPPSMSKPVSGCPFAPRCPFVQDRCIKETPPLEAVNDNARDRAACWRKDEILVTGNAH